MMWRRGWGDHLVRKRFGARQSDTSCRPSQARSASDVRKPLASTSPPYLRQSTAPYLKECEIELAGHGYQSAGCESLAAWPGAPRFAKDWDSFVSGWLILPIFARERENLHHVYANLLADSSGIHLARLMFFPVGHYEEGSMVKLGCGTKPSTLPIASIMPFVGWKRLVDGCEENKR